MFSIASNRIFIKFEKNKEDYFEVKQFCTVLYFLENKPFLFAARPTLSLKLSSNSLWIVPLGWCLVTKYLHTQ